MRTRVLAVAAGVAVAAAVIPMAARGASSTAATMLTGDIPRVTGATPLGPAPAATPLHIGIVLAGRDDTGLASFIAAGGQVTPDQFAARFGATPAEGTAVRHWLTAAGASVPGDQPLDSRFVLVTGTVRTVGKLLNVRFASFKTARATFVANLDPPVVPSGLGIRTIVGLDTAAPFHSVAKTVTAPISQSTSPADLWKLYEQPAGDTAPAQRLATLLWGSVNEYQQVRKDLVRFEGANHLPRVPLTFVAQDGYVDPGAKADLGQQGLTETDLDVQAATGMAPGAAGLTLYEASSGDEADLTNVATKWVRDPNGARQLSASFAGCETLDMMLVGGAMDTVFQQAAAEGRTVFAASGDAGAGCSVVANVANTPIIQASYPASSPWVVAVGGTVVTEDRHASPMSEYAWTGSGGGTSLYETRPAWQRSVSAVVGRCLESPASAFNGDIPPEGANAPCRGVPDVAAQSGDMLSGYDTWIDGSESVVTGTSLSAPLWQGVWARVNAASRKRGGTGFAAPILYRLGTAATHGRDFHDITFGDNGPFPATTGWDYVTGFGSPDVANLIVDVNR